MFVASAGGRRSGLACAWLLAAMLVGGCGGSAHDRETAAARGAVSVASSLPDPGADGPYAVGFSELRYVDEGRAGIDGEEGRPVAVFLWYPVDAAAVSDDTPRATYPLVVFSETSPRVGSSVLEGIGVARTYQHPEPSRDAPFPLVMFSPGFGYDATHYLLLAVRLASHGFVVAAVSHPREPGLFAAAEPDSLSLCMVNRPLDVSLALAGILDASAGATGPLGALVDPGRIAAMGHSLGGYTAMALAAGDDSVCDAFETWIPGTPETCVPTVSDPRFRVIVSLDGASEGLTWSEYARIRIPVLTVAETDEALAFQGYPGYEARVHAAIASPVNHRVDVEGANHMSFSSLCSMFGVWREHGLWREEFEERRWAWCNPENVFLPGGVTLRADAEVNAITSRYAVAFLQTHLAGKQGYTPILTRGWACTREDGVHFFRTEDGGQTRFGPGASWLDPGWLDEFDYHARLTCEQPLRIRSRSPSRTRSSRADAQLQ